MHKLWLVFRYEYGRHVFRWRFLLSLLSLPFMVLLMIGLFVIMIWTSLDRKPVGYVDFSGLLKDAGSPSSSLLSFLSYADVTEARKALQDGTISAYYVLPADFRQNRQVELYYQKKPDALVGSEFGDLLSEKFLSGYPETYVRRLVNSPLIVPRLVSAPVPSAGDSKPSSETGSLTIARTVFSYFAIFVFMASLSTCTGYLLNIVTDEKTNRTMEILVTSVSPSQLMLGKLLAAISVGLTQLFFWASLPLCFLIPLAFFAAPSLARALPDWPLLLGLFGILALPTFLLQAALVMIVSSLLGDGRLSSDANVIVTLLFSLSFFIAPFISANPDGVIAIVFSFFPLTAFVTIMLRLIFTIPPAWQTVVSILIVLLSAGGSLWLSGKAFRFGMLRYGQSLSFSFKEIVKLVRRR